MNTVGITANRPEFLNHWALLKLLPWQHWAALAHARTVLEHAWEGTIRAVGGFCTVYWSRKMCSCCTLMRRSVSLNSYGMFQPSGPNFRLSCTSAWKKQRPYSNVLNSALKPNTTTWIINISFKQFHFLTVSFFPHVLTCSKPRCSCSSNMPFVIHG